ncbi:Protein furry [Blattella germanica]|nr:Protein furry [Blattella germanica]
MFLQHVLRVFRDSLPHALISERWAQTALQLGLSCSSRHYAGRSLQVFRALRVPITSRMLSDILSRLVETVAEQGEDMQGYVTELLLTLEAAVDSLESDFRPLDFMKEIFKSTPNLNNKESVGPGAVVGGKRSPGCGVGYVCSAGPLAQHLGQAGHTRSTSYSVSYCMRKASGSPAADNKDMRGRTSSELEARSGCSLNKYSTNLSRSRSAQSLKLLGDSATQDDKMTILAQLFWLSVSLLESDYEHEFLLALRLLSRVLHRLPLDRPDARDKVEKLQAQLKWTAFPGVHALLLKGCTSPNTYEPVVTLLSQFTPLLDLPVVDPSQSLAFPMNVVALLPYMLLNYEDANELCIRSAENIAQASTEKSKKLENLGTVMTLYSRRTFSKESFQWTKCVVKYLYDTYAHLSLNMLAFLVEVLEKGPAAVQLPVLSIIHCMLHYVDLASAAAQPMNADLLRVIAKYIEGAHYKEALKILKLVVTRSSTLVAPPTSLHPPHWETSATSPHPSFTDNEIFTKKELPGRTMDFTFDLSQTPVIGRRFLVKGDEKGPNSGSAASPRRSVSLSPADNASIAGWKRPWMSQGRVRECLVNLLTTCGQRVGLPKSPSVTTNTYVIFSQSSDLMERQSSMASSTEEVSGPMNDLSGGSRRDEGATEQFGVFKDFDFLEYESESVEGESTDNFNWGVRRRPLSDGETEREPSLRQLEESLSEKTPVLDKRKQQRGVAEESSDDEVGSESPLDEVAVAPEFGGSSAGGSGVYPPSSLNLREHRTRHDSGTRSDTSGSSTGDLGDVTPCNASPNLSALMAFRPIMRDDTEEAWRLQIQSLLNQIPASPMELFQLLHRLIRCIDTVKTTVKLNLLGENQPELGNEELVLDLGRALYKLHFQLLLLIEASNKMVAALTTMAHNNQLQDVSAEVVAVKASLTRVVEEGGDSDHGTPTPTPSPAPTPVPAGCEEVETALLELVQAEKWAAALRHARHNRGAWATDVSPGGAEEDEITGILNVFCKHLAHDKSDVFVVTRTEQDLTEVFTRLMESLFQVLGAVNALDSQVREQREHGESSLRKTDC